jgi:hypothetical protein
VSPRAGALTALAAGLALILVVLLAALAQSKPRLAGTNNVRDPVFAVVLPAGATVCQGNESVPADTDRARVLIGTYGRPMPPLTFTATGPGGRVAGRRAGGDREGYVTIPVARNERVLSGLKLCLRNDGAQKIAIGGEGIPPPAKIGRRDADGRMRIAWLRPGSENWFDLAGTVLHRFGYGNAPWFGGWLLVLVIFVLGGAVGLAANAVLREPDEVEPE